MSASAVQKVKKNEKECVLNLKKTKISTDSK